MEVFIKVELQINLDDETMDLAKVKDSARIAVETALDFAENAGFVHPLAYEMSIGVGGVEVVDE